MNKNCYSLKRSFWKVGYSIERRSAVYTAEIQVLQWSLFANDRFYIGIYPHGEIFLSQSKEGISPRGKDAFVRDARKRAHLESPFCSPAVKMRRAAWWEAPYPRRVQHPAASRSPAEAPGPSAASRSVAADVRPARTSSRSPKSRPRSCLPAEVSFSRGFPYLGLCPDQPSLTNLLFRGYWSPGRRARWCAPGLSV